jgi:hypothetical protein
MWKLRYLIPILFLNLLFPSFFSHAKEVTISLAVTESIDLNVDFTAYCLFKTTFNNMGFKIKQIKLPSIRTLTEVQNGTVAIALIGKTNFKTDSKPKTIPHDIAITSTAYNTMKVSVFSLKNSKIEMNNDDWHTRYIIGVERSSYTHNTSQHHVTKVNNYYFYLDALSAFKALVRNRIDIVISPELDYNSAKLHLNLTDEVKPIDILGTASLYLGFSHKYFGEKEAKNIANRYDIKRSSLTKNEIKQCNKSNL